MEQVVGGSKAIYSGAKEMAYDVRDIVTSPVSTASEIASSVYSISVDSVQMALMLVVAMQWVSVIKHFILDRVMAGMTGVDQNWGKVVSAIIVTTVAVVIGLISKKVLKYGGVPRPVTYAVMAPMA